jgi:hypothetical protein
MRGSRVLGLLIAFVVGFLLLFAIKVGLTSAHSLGYEPPVLNAAVTGSHTATLSISTWPDSMQCHGSNGGAHPDWVTYCPTTSFHVPANSLITVRITNYDSGGPVKNLFFAQAQGTVGGTETVDGKRVYGLNSANNQIAHTFTIQSVPDSPAQLFVSVPVAAVSDNAPNALTFNGSQYPRPRVTAFKFYSGRSGNYIWKCYDPCGEGLTGFQTGFGGPMATTGYMAGTLTVG